MNRSLLEELQAYFSMKETLDEKEKHLLQQLNGELPYFKTTSVSRDDLEHLNFNVSNITDADMETIARKMGDDYCNQLYWTSLDLIAEDYLNIPRKGTVLCPKCGKHPVEYDAENDTHYCTRCIAEWSDRFVLVEFPEDASHFEQNDIGYPCFNVDDNGARYISEYDYIKHFCKNPYNVRYFKPVLWPESQEFIDNLFCEAITDDKGLKEFGPSSFWVPAIKTNNENFYKLLNGFSFAMLTAVDVEFSIAKYYQLDKYMEYFQNYDNHFSFNDETENDIQDLKKMHNSMMEEIKKLNPDEAAKIEKALSQV